MVKGVPHQRKGAVPSSEQGRAAQDGGGLATSGATARRGVSFGVVLMAACLLGARGLGFVREMLVASHFGPLPSTDAAYAALALLTTYTTVLQMAAPNLVARYLYGRDVDSHAKRGALWGAVYVWVAFQVVFAAFVVAWPSPWQALVMSSRSSVAQADLATSIRIAGAAAAFHGISMPLAAIASAERWYWTAATLSIFVPLCSAAAVAIAGGTLGPNSLLVGFGFAAMFQIALLGWAFWHARLAPTLHVPWGVVARAGRDALRLAVPLVAGIIVLKSDVVVTTRLVSSISDGEVFIFTLANLIVNVPMSVANIAVGQTIVPTLAKAAAERDLETFAGTFTHSANLALLIVLPFAALLVADAEGVVRYLFVRGRFDAVAGAHCAALVRWWAAASPLLVLGVQIEDALSAHKHARLAALARGAFLAAMAVCCWIGAARFGAMGVLLGYLGTGVVRTLIVGAILPRTIGTTARQLWSTPSQLLGIGLAAVAATWGAKLLCSSAPTLIRLAAETGVACLVIVLGSTGLRIEPTQTVWRRLRARSSNWRRAEDPLAGTPPS